MLRSQPANIHYSEWFLRFLEHFYWRFQFFESYFIPGRPWWLRWRRILLQYRRPEFDPWVGKIPWRRKWLLTPVFLPGESHGQRSLTGYSPWGREESDTTEWLTLSLSLNNLTLSTLLESFSSASITKSDDHPNYLSPIWHLGTSRSKMIWESKGRQTSTKGLHCWT